MSGRWPPVAALFVEPDGAYAGIEGVEVWVEGEQTAFDFTGEHPDARRYTGPHPVVAHPPCARWCRLAGFAEARWGYKRGEDDGCFEAALEAVRRWGGVLEHPAYSAAWKHFGLAAPTTGGGWERADERGGWTCYVEQQRYGHRAKKATWLYAVGVELPELRWGHVSDAEAAGPSWCGPLRKPGDERAPAKAGAERMGKRETKATPVEFRDVLLAMARSALR